MAKDAEYNKGAKAANAAVEIDVVHQGILDRVKAAQEKAKAANAERDKAAKKAAEKARS